MLLPLPCPRPRIRGARPAAVALIVLPGLLLMAGPRIAGRPSASDRPPPGAEREFRTDFARHSIPYDEVLSGGPPKDGIPAIDRPRFIGIEEADRWLKPTEPVVSLALDGRARAYPLQILTWHELVNDTLGEVPVVVTFCPLCNTAIVFERRLDGRLLDFGATGRLCYSNLIMYDRQTESWWQQATGESIAGELTGARLVHRAAPIIAWRDFKRLHPEGEVLSRRTGHERPYGKNPYAGYDDVRRSPFLYSGPVTPGRLPGMARVLTIDRSGDTVAYPYDLMRRARVVNDRVGDDPIVVLWGPGTASALDAGTVAGGRDVGTAAAYSRRLGDRVLTFTYDGAAIVDRGTGTRWDIFGRAVEGELEGKSLEPIVAVNHFWFSWAAFRPETRVYVPDREESGR